MIRRTPDFIVFNRGSEYLRRWWLIPRNRIFNIYLHNFLRSDEDRALHDHPWFNLSILLDGSYIEETIVAGGIHKRKLRKSRTLSGIKLRSPWTAHRVELIDDKPCWSLFITGPVIRTWGFHCRNGWRPWYEFVSAQPKSNDIGPGCTGLE